VMLSKAAATDIILAIGVVHHDRRETAIGIGTNEVGGKPLAIPHRNHHGPFDSDFVRWFQNHRLRCLHERFHVPERQERDDEEQVDPACVASFHDEGLDY
jgi:hypothetical protein